MSPPASSPPGCRRRQPGGDQFPSPANLIDANRPRGLTRDSLLAATALEHNLVLITRNLRDVVDLQLTVVNPWQADDSR